MDEHDILGAALQQFAGLTPEEFALSEGCWQYREFKKGEFYNEYKNVCKYLGFIIEGVFRTYYVDDRSDEEKNVFFFSQHQIVVSFQSFIAQAPCNYYTQSMTASKILYIHIDDLQKLYTKSHGWERLGRRIAETAFSMAIRRTEDFLFLSPEQRYLDLMSQHPTIFNSIPLYHISSYLGIQSPSLSRIRKRLVGR
ncbi:MAG: Crp/Fnr family transcriptional regulator [Flavobacterium sp.]|nr:MAG: Crp/Fnr family transcriptional regulator [Flavobacterium sp.]